MKKIFFLLLLLPTFSPAQTLIQADPHRMEARIQALAQFGLQPNGGVMRPGFSEEDIKARQYVMDLMKKMKLDVHIDAAGNLIGEEPDKIMTNPIFPSAPILTPFPTEGNTTEM
jgi:N-carbamoyl-L-amino-acid hydrolase